MKRIKNYISLYVLTFLLCCVNMNAQTNLSREGAAHLRAAETLKSMMVNADDKLQVAEEYEKVIKSDPNYAKAYIEAARIYSALTPELGTSAYNKAKQLYKTYVSINPSASSEIDADLIVLEAMLKKFSNSPVRIDGIWQQYSSYTGKSWDVLEVSGNGSNVRLIDPAYQFTTPGYGSIRDVRISVNGSQCFIVVKVFHDERSRLREKGWTKYYDDCDGNADPGFPRSGRYYYNESLTTWYYTVDLSKTPLVMECEKIHTDYYFNGSNTYSDTDMNRLNLFKKELIKK
ncbi:MAG: hypothetical protein IJY03_09660 [Prevotella sp.]|nr:hypothetical protein [Prevotella sp.]